MAENDLVAGGHFLQQPFDLNGALVILPGQGKRRHQIFFTDGLNKFIRQRTEFLHRLVARPDIEHALIHFLQCRQKLQQGFFRIGDRQRVQPSADLATATPY